MIIRPFNGKAPSIAPDVFLAPDAVVIGDVTIGAGSSAWYGSVIRGDVHWIRIGERTNLQDHAVLHVSTGTHPLKIGSDVTVGHRAILHGCEVEDECLIGMGAIVLDGAKIGAGALVAAGALVPVGMHVPPGTLVAGAPAQVKRLLGQEERERHRQTARQYQHLAAQHRALLTEP
ncbi:MAG: gamma carbonic anhydrase family protein [Bacteroidetes bacterium]|jgi:carbonic anhydrase/acetyltransferase-like protein (isoleucine patch superfamily)|nr:gamma carbonic anhydrase family protein [Bacteroidota bacterium]